jgi:hypothetical protein
MSIGQVEQPSSHFCQIPRDEREAWLAAKHRPKWCGTPRWPPVLRVTDAGYAVDTACLQWLAIRAIMRTTGLNPDLPPHLVGVSVGGLWSRPASLLRPVRRAGGAGKVGIIYRVEV